MAKWPPQTGPQTILPLDEDQLVLRIGQFNDPDRITPKHICRNLGWIIAGTENDDFSRRELFQQTFEVVVGRD